MQRPPRRPGRAACRTWSTRTPSSEANSPGSKARWRVLQERLGAQDAADEHHRVELETARADAADAPAQLREAHVRVEEWRRRVAETGERQALAERQRDQAEQERAAVIAALGRRARKHLDSSNPPSD